MTTGTEDVEFKLYMEKVDAILDNICGLSHRDLTDVDYRDMFECGDSPKTAARAALEASGMEMI